MTDPTPLRPNSVTVSHIGTMTGGTSMTPPPTSSQRARAAFVATRLHSREALDDALAHLAEAAARAADVSELPALPPGVTEDLARLGEHIAVTLLRVQSIMRRVGK